MAVLAQGSLLYRSAATEAIIAKVETTDHKTVLNATKKMDIEQLRIYINGEAPLFQPMAFKAMHIKHSGFTGVFVKDLTIPPINANHLQFAFVAFLCRILHLLILLISLDGRGNAASRQSFFRSNLHNLKIVVKRELV
jgi:hypothetical protein